MSQFHSRWLTENQSQTLCYSTDETDKSPSVSDVSAIVDGLEPNSTVCTECGKPLHLPVDTGHQALLWLPE